MEAFRWCFEERRRRRLTAGLIPVRRSGRPPVHWRLGGRYRLIEPVGHGGWSTVWRGHDERLGRPVAVKLLPASQAKWVRREARALAGLTHAHIAMIFDYDCTEAECYLVMELVEGRSLAEALADGPLPWAEAVGYCAQVASALAAAHQRRLVHLDVTPGNIMLSSSGVKLIDFGVSGVVGAAEPDEEFRATPAYVAPERLAGTAVGPPGDVFGLGVVLYKAIAGRAPWTGDTVSEILAAVATTKPLPLPPVPGLPEWVGRACLRCLSRDPADRPTAQELANTLARAIPPAIDRTVVVDASRWRTTAPAPHGARLVPIAILAVIAIGLAVFGLRMAQWGPDSPPIAAISPWGAPAPSSVDSGQPYILYGQSDGAAALEGAAQRDLIGVLQVAADRQPAGQASHGEPHRLDQQGQVGRRGLALGVGVGRQNQLLHGSPAKPDHQLPNV
jgi:hypothetical protein